VNTPPKSHITASITSLSEYAIALCSLSAGLATDARGVRFRDWEVL
jgi:hypothetical protein